MLYKGVGTQHNKEADNALEQTNSTGLGEVEAVHHRTVYVGFDNVRGGEQHRIITDQIIEQAEVPLQNTANGEQEQHDHSGLQGGKNDVANLLKAVGPIDLRGLQHGGIHAGNGGKVYHRTIAGSLPDVHQDDDQGPRAGVLVNFRHFASHRANQIGDEAEVEVQQVVDQQGNQHVGDEVGQEHQGLGGLLEGPATHLVQQNRKEHLQHVSDNDEGQIIQNRVAQQQRQLTGGKEEGEVFQSDEGTAKDPLSIIVLDEGDIHAWHRHIAEDEEESYGGQTHEDQCLILPEHSANLRS